MAQMHSCRTGSFKRSIRWLKGPSLRMRAFYHPDQSLHDPQQYMRFGQIVAPKDLPERTAQLLAALKAHGMAPELPAACGRKTPKSRPTSSRTT